MIEKPEDGTPDAIDGELAMPSVNERKKSNAGRGILLLGGFAVLVLGLGSAYFWWVRSQEKAEEPKPKAVEQASAAPSKKFDLAPPPPPPAPAEGLAEGTVPPVDGQESAPIPLAGESDTQTAPQPQAAPQGPVKPRPKVDKSGSALMVEAGGRGSAVGRAMTPEEAIAVAKAAQPAPAAKDQGGLASLLSGTSTEARMAGRLGDRNFLLAKGSQIDCVLVTRLDTTVPGMATCLLTRDVYSDNGKVLLLERGSRAEGEYSNGLQQGQNRIFVLWTRIRTPTGVTIGLDSPGTDELGASGLTGKVNNHFWKRFGAAMLMSLIDDIAAAAVQQSGTGNTTINTGNSADAANDVASKILDSTANIPPTLYKKQGERISILVARDLNFGSVYALRTQ